MNLRRRVAAAEGRVGPPDDVDGPISLTELLSGARDERLRRKLGRGGVRKAVVAFRAVAARIETLMAEDPGEVDDTFYEQP